METRHLKPSAPDLVVRNPATGLPLPAAGAEVEMNTFWARRLRDGDVEEFTPPKAARKAAE
jgi:hypothetical protein